jgi:hypothetical protein
MVVRGSQRVAVRPAIEAWVPRSQTTAPRGWPQRGTYEQARCSGSSSPRLHVAGHRLDAWHAPLGCPACTHVLEVAVEDHAGFGSRTRARRMAVSVARPCAGPRTSSPCA